MTRRGFFGKLIQAAGLVAIGPTIPVAREIPWNPANYAGEWAFILNKESERIGTVHFEKSPWLDLVQKRVWTRPYRREELVRKPNEN